MACTRAVLSFLGPRTSAIFLSNTCTIKFQVALVVDRLCLLLFFLAMTIASVAILTSSPHIWTASQSDLRKAAKALDDTTTKTTTDPISEEKFLKENTCSENEHAWKYL